MRGPFTASGPIAKAYAERGWGVHSHRVFRDNAASEQTPNGH